MTSSSATTVVIADDDAGVRGALGDLITACDGLELSGVGETGHEAAALCEQHHPDLAVVDVMMPGGGEAAIAGIRAVSPSTTVVVYTARAGRSITARMLEAGAVLVLAKHGDADIASELLRAGAGTADEA